MARNNRNIRKRGDRFQVNWIDAAGKRRYRTFDTHKEAAAFLRAAQARVDEIHHGVRRALPSKDFDDLVDLWERVKGPEKRSIKDDRSRIRVHLRPALEGCQVRDIGPTKVLTIREAVEARGCSRATVRQVLGLLQAMLTLAWKHHWLAEQPRIDRPKQSDDQERNYIRTWEQVQAFLRAAEEEDYPGLAALYATAIYTGLRVGELAALRWSDIRDDWRVITVRRSWNTKTKSGKVRHVPLQAALVARLKAWKLESPHGDLVFPNRTGKMHAKAARPFNRIFKRCCARVGLRDLRFHDLRHTFASHWVMNGGDIFRLQKAMGHATIVMTNKYSHLAPEAVDDDIDLLPAVETGAGEVVPLHREVDDEDDNRAPKASSAK